MRQIAIAVAAATLLSPVGVHADLLQRVQADASLQVAVANEPPFAYIDKQGDLTGYSPTMLRTLLERLGWEGELRARIVEWSGMINGLKTGRVDIIASAMYILPPRCDEVAFTRPTMQAPVGLIVPADRPRDLKDHADLTPYPDAKLGITAGTIHRDYAHQAGLPDEQIDAYESVNDLFLAVETGQVAAASITRIHAKFARKRWPDDYDLAISAPIYTLGGKPATGHAAFAVRPTESDFVKALDQEIARFVGSDAYLEKAAPFGVTETNLPKKSRAELCRKRP